MVTMGIQANTTKNFEDGRIYVDIRDLIAALALAPSFITKSELIRDLNQLYDKAMKEDL
jgi:hypothetical protein